MMTIERDREDYRKQGQGIMNNLSKGRMLGLAGAGLITLFTQLGGLPHAGYTPYVHAAEQTDVFDKEKLIEAFEKREKFITDRLQAIAKENNERFRREMERDAEKYIAAADTEDVKTHMARLKDFLNESYDKQNLVFSKSTRPIPQGGAGCMPIVGLRIVMTDPNTSTDPVLAADDTVSFIIQRKYSQFDNLNYPGNLLIYNNAMRYVYEFFKGMITREELDGAIAEIMQSKDPEYTITKKFKDREYTFRYNDEIAGVIEMSFRL